MPDGELTIRLARESDAQELLKIYEPYVKGTVISFEYDVPTVQEFAARIRNILKKYPYFMALTGDEIVGYAYASPFKPRAAYEWAVETSIYVRSNLKGRGVGGRLYRALEEALGRMNIQNLNACIAYPNPESVGFHERLGYRIIGHFSKCGYKLDAWHDMVWMEKFIGTHEVPPKAVVPYPQLSEVR